MWHAQMDIQVKMELSPEMASIQLNASVRVLDPAATMKHNSPTHAANKIDTIGRPVWSIYPRILGAWPRSASAASVRDDP